MAKWQRSLIDVLVWGSFWLVFFGILCDVFGVLCGVLNDVFGGFICFVCLFFCFSGEGWGCHSTKALFFSFLFVFVLYK